MNHDGDYLGYDDPDPLDLTGDDPGVDHDDLDGDVENCCGFWASDGTFQCAAAGSEDCDCCPLTDDIGMTADELDAEDFL